jgi:hypothetical protein
VAHVSVLLLSFNSLRALFTSPGGAFLPGDFAR